MKFTKILLGKLPLFAAPSLYLLGDFYYLCVFAALRRQKCHVLGSVPFFGRQLLPFKTKKHRQMSIPSCVFAPRLLYYTYHNRQRGGEGMRKAYSMGGLFFLIHFLVEVTSFYILTAYTPEPAVWALMLLYDFTAFVPQGVFGYLRDRGIRVNFALWGTVLTTLSLTLMLFRANVFLIITLVSLGNCLVHIHGAERTLRASPGKITPAAVFVSGGSFGVITGKLLAMSNVAVPWVLALNVLTFVPIVFAERLKPTDDAANLRQYRFANLRIGAGVVIALATFVVAVRAYMGYGIPTTWNKTTLQTIALYCAMGAGKALGGVLTDRIGIRKTALISTLGALPFLLFGAERMAISLIGIAIFSMTMAITLALIVSCLQTLPGVAFGFTTLGLFLGTVPLFFVRIRSVTVNCIIISILSVVCAVILYAISAKRTTNTEKE